jgi:predicted nuclease of restriction endonuclease-like (RecB) superfamily
MQRQLAQTILTLSVNRELVLLYWQIGRDILDRQGRELWGAKVIERLAADLRKAFPDMRGFSPRNIKYMRAFAQAWPEPAFVQGVLAQLPWYHQLVLLEKLRTAEERRWYADKVIEHGWSRNVLAIHVESRLRDRSGQAVTNFAERLPAPLSDLAQERVLEAAIVEHITRFLAMSWLNSKQGRSVLNTPQSLGSSSRPWTPKSSPRMTDRPSVYCCARARTKS